MSNNIKTIYNIQATEIVKIKFLKLLSFAEKNSYFVLALMGALLSLSFAPYFIFPIIFISIPVLMVYITISKDYREAFQRSFVFGFFHFLSSMYWLTVAVTVYEEFIWLAPIAAPSIAFILSFFIGFTCLIPFKFKDSKYFGIIFGVSWVFFEWVRSWIFTGLPWNLLGYTAAFSDIMMQPASMFGTYGVSFLLVVASLPLFYVIDLFRNSTIVGNFAVDSVFESSCRLNYTAVLHSKSPKNFSTLASFEKSLFKKKFLDGLTSIILSGIIIFSMYLIGKGRIHDAKNDFKNIRVSLVQPSIKQELKWNKETIAKDLAKYYELSQIHKDVDLVIWPESAVIVPHRYVESILRESIPNENAMLITGGVGESFEDGYKIYSSLYSYERKGSIEIEYHKKHRVPFGEYVPFAEFLPIKKITSGFIDYSMGNTKDIFNIEKLNIKVRPLVCYEVIFPDEVISKKDKESGNIPELFINITNDAWYGKTSAPYQHFTIARFRAVENGVPMLRAGNNGISAIIDSYGRVVKASTLNEITSIYGNVPENIKGGTIFLWYGNYTLLVLIPLVLLLFCLIRSILNINIISLYVAPHP